MSCNKHQGCNMNCNGCSKRTNNKLDTFDWLCDIPEAQAATDFVEVIFKNTRKGYYRNTNNLMLHKGDMVAVESSPGHDIGTVSLTGQLVLLQMKKNKIDPMRTEIKRIYRIAREVDLEKYEEAKAREHETMLKSRRIAEDLHLNMKIGDVEYQGDGNKAIFYYIADERVDFRQLIKVLADTFKVRIEMRQIGARQEAGRIGGIGPCGRPLCCSSWMSSFVSVSTSAARYQEISLNPQKLAGQCAKLKCCLNFEQDCYIEAQKEIPARDIPLETKDGTFYHFKTDVFAKTMQYSSDPHFAANLVTLSTDRVREIQALNKRGEKVDNLLDEESQQQQRETKYAEGYQNVVGQDSLTRFDKKKKHKNKGDKKDRNEKKEQGNQPAQPDNNPDTPDNQGEQAANEQPRNERGDRRDRGDRRNRNDRRDRGDRKERDRGDRRDRNERGENGQDQQNPDNGGAQNNNQGEQTGNEQPRNERVDRRDRGDRRNRDRRDRGDRHNRDRRDRGDRREQNDGRDNNPNQPQERHNQGNANNGGNENA